MSHLRQRVLQKKPAQFHVDIIIVGAGIGGIACAYACAKSGHRVHVIEKNDGPYQRSVGIRVPPNLTLVLKEWGLTSQIENTQLHCRHNVFHSYENGEIMGRLEWHADVIKEMGAHFLLMHYDDLYQILYNLCLAVGVKISFDSVVEEITYDAKTSLPCVVLEDGRTLSADILIGSDGTSSMVREFVNGPDDGQESGCSFLTVMVPAEKLLGDPYWAKYATLPEWQVYMGDTRSALGYPVRGGEEYCLHVYWPDQELRDNEDVPEGWNSIVPTSLIDFTGYDPNLQRLFHMAKDAIRTKFVSRGPIEDWLDDTGRIILMGDAAHPFMPCSTQGPAMAVEDAACLGHLLSHLKSPQQIPQLLEAFQDLRQERCKFVNESELGNAALCTMPPGEHRDARDAGLRVSLTAGNQHWDDGALLEQFESVSSVFAYNAVEHAEDWWLKWGILGDDQKDKPVQTHQAFQMKFEVTETTTESTTV